MRITLCQLNTIAGDSAGNTARIRQTIEATRQDSPDLLVFPELFVQGYPPRDLLEYSWFVGRGLRALDEICEFSRSCPGTGILFGCAMPNRRSHGKGLYNSAVLVSDGAVLFHQNKTLLPSYDVFDETRYFDPAARVSVFEFKGEKLGISICEDAWNHPDLWTTSLYRADPIGTLARQGATILINISGSPFHMGKEKLRFSVMQRHAAKHRLPLVFVNQVGGNDDLIFDGNSLFLDARGEPRGHLRAFEEGTLTIDTTAPGPAIEVPEQDTVRSVHDALVLGLRDYVRKCGFVKALLGLSGGIDSAVTACLAAEAVGPANVLGVTMPSRYSSEGSRSDSRDLARNLGMEFKEIAIEGVFDALLRSVEQHFDGRQPDLAEENMQARIRGTILMALSNKFGHLLLSTGNKSEMAVGYCTLYGDMNGGLSVISDLPKTMVYQLADYINRDREVIPRACITKPPSAELRPNQKDQDSLPPYDVLDQVLTRLVEGGQGREEIVTAGFEPATVDFVIRAIKTSEYKRRQAAPGLRVTPKAFGSGRRFPIAARYEVL